MELFPHQLKFTFLSPCPHVDYLFCSCSRKGNILLPRAQTCILGEALQREGGEWRRHDSLVYATFSACNCHWCCGNIYRAVYTPTVLKNLFSWWLGYVVLRVVFFNSVFSEATLQTLIKPWKSKPLKWENLKRIPSHSGMYEFHRPCPQAVVWVDGIGDEGDWMAGWHGSTPRPTVHVALRWLVKRYTHAR